MELDPVQVKSRLSMAAELLEVGVSLVRQRLRRQHPDAPPADIETMVVRWRTKADEPSDAPGNPCPWPRSHP